MNDAVKVIGGVVGGLLLIGTFGAIITPDSNTSGASAPIVQETESYEYTEEEVIQEPELTEKDEFIACVNSSGLDTEKSAVKHVTKVTGTRDFNDIADMPEVWTDLTGDWLTGNDIANVIASGFVSCYEGQSENGLVTIYNESGDMLTMENF